MQIEAILYSVGQNGAVQTRRRLGARGRRLQSAAVGGCRRRRKSCGFAIFYGLEKQFDFYSKLRGRCIFIIILHFQLKH
jgi:hypothetical protein